MDSILRKLPVPIAGLMLGLAASGNLVQSYSNILRNLFGLASGIILIMMIVKIITQSKGVKEALENPVVASVFPTLSMTVILLAGYLKPLSHEFALILWFTGIILHIILMGWFTKQFVMNYNIKKVFPSWFIVYVGIVVASVTAGAFEMQAIGKIIFYFGLTSYFILLPIVLKRVYVIKEIPEAALPTLVIISAPASLCLAGYLNSFTDRNMVMVYLLLIISQITYLAVLLMLQKLLKLKFYPSYSGFTFPLVISAISLKLTNGFLINTGNSMAFMKSLVNIEEFIAISMVVYVLIRYINFLLSEDSSGVKVKTVKV